MGTGLKSKNIHENEFTYHSELYTSAWSNSFRAGVFCIGLLSLFASTRLNGPSKKALSLFGILSLIRSIANRNVTDLVGSIANPAVHLKRTIQIDAPVEDIYEFLIHFSNYPRFMSYILKVEVNEAGGLRWTAKGPDATIFQWDTAIGRLLKNQAISWKTVGYYPIRNFGEIQLVDLQKHGTQLHIELIYALPLGALGYAAAHYLGFDPKEKIDNDLRTLKTLLENSSRLKFPPKIETHGKFDSA